MIKSEEYWGFPLKFSNCYHWVLVEDWMSLYKKENYFQWLVVTWRHHCPMSQLRRSNSTLVQNDSHPHKPPAHMVKGFCLSTISRGHDAFLFGLGISKCHVLCVVTNMLYQHAAGLWLLRIIVSFLFIARATKIHSTITNLCLSNLC